MDIFIIKTDNSRKISEDILNEFQQKIITNQKQLKIHCFTYYMLDKILKEKYAICSPQIIYKDNKPVLKNGEKHFSISHSGDYIAIAFSNSNCGVDIEKIKNRDFKKIAERMSFVCEDLESFYKEWTLYEAQYKLNKNNSRAKQSYKTQKQDDYFITAVSENIEEDFNFMIEFL